MCSNSLARIIELAFIGFFSLACILLGLTV
jgi:hypothetical protein